MKTMFKMTVLTCLLLYTACTPSVDEPEEMPPFDLIPYPQNVEAREGSFAFNDATEIRLSDPSNESVQAVASHLAAMLRRSSGFDLPISENAATQSSTNTIILSSTRINTGDESYRLTVTPETVSLTAPAPVGLFRGIQTLRQLLPVDVERPFPDDTAVDWSIPTLEIDDTPRFSYRGMHLDVGRHFFPVSFVKKYIDLLAMYKMNTFHWHLTDDQGWRIEIKKYPRLTEVGAYRKETILEKNFDPYVGDGEPYGGFYTQDEIREVVAYARERFITVIPEIEMPGHSMAALAAYPELACTEGPFEVATRWGVFEDIFCPKEETFQFLEDVLTETMDLFPSIYIHIGGDEAPKNRWEESQVAQVLIEREGLADEHELQSYFIRRIERFLLDHGRRLIGWDEILEGGLAPEATVMAWRGTEGGIEAARQGHDVIMTPTDYCYLDYYQGDPDEEPLAIGGNLPLEKVYSLEPVPEALTPEEARHILGAQGNVWTEYMKTPDYVEYMVMPRMLALSEVVWSPKEGRNFDGFMKRLQPHLKRLDVLGVNYRDPK